MNPLVRVTARTKASWRGLTTTCRPDRQLPPGQRYCRQPTQLRHLTSAADLSFGQPLHETHPHLLKAGELTRGISALEYAERRARLAHALPPNSIAVLAAADLKYRSGSVFYRYHQDSDFLYLTGFNEPDALAIIEKTGPGPEHNFHLFVRPKDARIERWEGSRSGVEAAQDVFNADHAGNIKDVLTHLRSMLDGSRVVYTDVPVHNRTKSTFPSIIFGSSGSKEETLGDVLQKATVKRIRQLMNDLRVIKSDAEVANLRQAGKASGRAFTEAMKHRFRSETDLENFIEYQFKFNGCEESAYVPVVGGAERAYQIHYVRNDALLEQDALVTVDAGGEYGGYIADITRAWPVNGKFTDAQKELYEMILAVQRSCVSLCTEEANMTLDKLHSVAEEGLKDGLQSLGFDMSRNSMADLFPHHLGHFIGLDVHDAPGHPRTNRLSTNQCITIEPGIYVANEERWPKHFRGMNIRIEDSVCIKADSVYNLTVEAVKEVVDIEALRR